MLVGDNIRKAFRLMGFSEDGSIQMRPFLVNALCLSLCANTVMSILLSDRDDEGEGEDTHGDTIHRLLAAKDVNVLLTIFGFSMEYMFVSKNLMTLIHITDKKFLRYRLNGEESRDELVFQRKTSQRDLLRKTCILLFIIVCTLIFLPVLVSTYIVLTNDKRKVSELPLPIVFWYPEGYDLLATYVIAYVLQAAYLAHLLGHIYCVYGSVISSVQALLIDIELLCIDLRDIDITLLKHCHDHKRDLLLRDYINYLIYCHQNILRNVRLFNSCASMVTTLGNQCICFQICIFLYCIAEIDNKFAKFGYFSIAFSEASVLFIYCYNGQKIINGNEDIRRHLYHCSWLNKPRWFKRDLLIMMSMADAPLHVKPFGLYILNLNNFTNIMNAAYSYFNMLRTLHK